MAALSFYRQTLRHIPANKQPSSLHHCKRNISTSCTHFIQGIQQQRNSNSKTISKKQRIINNYSKKYNNNTILHKRLLHTTMPKHDIDIFQGVESILVHIHDFTGLPWYGTIICSTLAFRLSFLPIVRKQILASENFKKASSDRQKASKLWEKTKGHRTFNSMKIYLQTLHAIKKKHDVRFLPLFFNPIFIQIPAFITFFMTMRRMIRHADTTTSELATGGILWFDNLTIPDETFLLPAFTIGMMFLNIERALAKKPTGSEYHPNSLFALKNWLQAGFIFGFPLISGFIPSGVFMYWGTSATYTLVQSHLLENNRFRTLIRVPLLPPSVGGSGGGGGGGGNKYDWGKTNSNVTDNNESKDKDSLDDDNNKKNDKRNNLSLNNVNELINANNNNNNNNDGKRKTLRISSQYKQHTLNFKWPQS